MPTTLFIADLHLCPERPDITDALLRFLSTTAQQAEALYILGDLFETWVGDDDDAALPARIAEALSQYAAAGRNLFIMRGNRDFLLGEDYCKKAGAVLIDDPTVLDLYGEKTLIMHGDTLCTEDKDYLAFRATARDPNWQAMVLGKPLDERRALATQIRTLSKEAASNKAQDIMDVTPEEVLRVMTKHNVTRLIHGHTHRPACHDIATGKRWVLGDWDSKLWYIEVNTESTTLIDSLL